MNKTLRDAHHIVVIDDNQSNIQVIGTLLRENGFIISVAQSGKHALEIIDKSNPDLILLDILMPEMNGFEVCCQIKRNPEKKDIPVIFLSALTDTINKVHGFDVGAVDYITKPIESKELLARVNLHLTISNLQKKLESSNSRLEEQVDIRTGELLAKQKNLEIEVEKHKETQKELNATKDFLKNIINSMPSMIVGIDEQCRITHWNLIAEKEKGISEHAAMGNDIYDFLEEVKPIKDILERSIHQQVIQKAEKLILQKDHKTRFVDVTIYPLASNETSGAVIRVDDVTERVRIEELMIQTEKMMSIGGLAAGMAHEINNPLAGIIQSLQVIKSRISAEIPQNNLTAEECGTTIESLSTYFEKRGINKMMDSASEAGFRAAKIVKNMLRFSRKSTTILEKHDLTGIMDDMIELASKDYDLKKKYDFKLIEIEKDFDEIPRVSCEASEIQQVLLNLLKNGAQSMFEYKQELISKGEKVAYTSKFILRLKRENNMVRMEIQDNGPGMDDETRKRIIEPFFTTKISGTGLGLSVSYFIITENHKGSMRVESAKGKGTNFIIHLPIDREEDVLQKEVL